MTMTAARPHKNQHLHKDEPTHVLVGIVTRNRAAIIPRAIESALSQEYVNLRIAIVDDGSEDQTSQLASRYSAVQWTHWKRSLGYVEGRNHLMCGTSADFYVSLDDDAWFIHGDEIRVAVQYMEANPKVAAVAFDILSPDRPLPTSRSNPRPTHLFIGCGHVVRMSAIHEAGVYASNPGLYGFEETDLCIRLLDRKWEIHYLPGVHVWHDKTTLSRDCAAQYRSSVCNDFAFAIRRCPLPLLMGIMPAKLLNHLRFSITNQLLNSFCQGVLILLRNAKALWLSREPVRMRTFLYFLRLSHQPR